jgi:chemotaxis-related protein WspD
MTTLPVTAPRPDCWNQIGVRGDHSCPELERVVHCHSCPVFARAGRKLLDAAPPPGYLAEWSERLATPAEGAAGDLQSVLIFRLADEWLALPVHVLVEVTDVRPVHRVPYHGGLLAGLVNIRGELHLCVHLAQLLGIAAPEGQPPPPRQRLVVVERDGERWVFPVDEVEQVHRFPVAELARVPATVGRSAAHRTRGVFSWRDRLVGYLDDERLLEALRAKIR